MAQVWFLNPIFSVKCFAVLSAASYCPFYCLPETPSKGIVWGKKKSKGKSRWITGQTSLIRCICVDRAATVAPTWKCKMCLSGCSNCITLEWFSQASWISDVTGEPPPSLGLEDRSHMNSVISHPALKWEGSSQHLGFSTHIVILWVGSEMICLLRFINFIFALKTGLEYLQCNYKNVLKLRRRKDMKVDAILMIV